MLFPVSDNIGYMLGAGLDIVLKFSVILDHFIYVVVELIRQST